MAILVTACIGVILLVLVGWFWQRMPADTTAVPALVPSNRLEELIQQDSAVGVSSRLRDELFASTLLAPSDQDRPAILSALVPGSLVEDAAGASTYAESPVALPPILPCFTSQQALDGAHHGLTSLLPSPASLRGFAAREVLERAAEADADVLLNPHTSLLRRIAASELRRLLDSNPRHP